MVTPGFLMYDAYIFHGQLCSGQCDYCGFHYHKKTYCGGPKPLLKPKKVPLKVHLTFSGGCYCGGTFRQCAVPLQVCCGGTKKCRCIFTLQQRFWFIAAGNKLPPYSIRVRRYQLLAAVSVCCYRSLYMLALVAVARNATICETFSGGREAPLQVII